MTLTKLTHAVMTQPLLNDCPHNHILNSTLPDIHPLKTTFPRRFMKSNPAKMGDQEYPILLCHGPNKYEVVVWGAMTLGELTLKIEAATHIPPPSQKIIFKGRNLTDCNVTLASYGIGPGSKVMVLGKRFDPEEDANYQAIVQIEQSCSRVEKTLCDIIPQVDGISGGYLESRLCGEALCKLRKQLLGVNEEFMRLLEQLDGISFEENQTLARQKRKSVVKRIQQSMEKSDQVHENINQLRLKYT
ncbi:BAG family molecular chaperone regulator 1-like isoform X1 [Panulirus ornatus]|uniref:BAG family molecular chaperone regulator 1-like isoform X1 n=2 Tax=Panulirus ornatus TaxID=150431 RepID=UPI003A851502